MAANKSLDKETAQSVAALRHHPGFVYLREKLAQQSADLDAKLHERQTDLREVDFLQSGIFWCGWLNRQLESITLAQVPKRAPLTFDDIQADFQRVDANLERLA